MYNIMNSQKKEHANKNYNHFRYQNHLSNRVVSTYRVVCKLEAQTKLGISLSTHTSSLFNQTQ